MRLCSAYRDWCEEWNEGLDEPSIASNLFMKYMESNRRCVLGVKRWNSWLLEVEGRDWMGAYSLSGKTNHVTEGCHKMDVMYGELPPHELEWRRANHFLMTKGGNAMSMDEVNKLQMLWNKGCASSQKFQLVCDRLQCLMATKACAYETFATRTRKNVIPSFEKDVCTLVDLLEKGDLYPSDCSEKRKFEEDFWWNHV